jgi:hypothetical protein
MNQHITIKQADALLEKYYEGATSKAEERLLWLFLQQSGLPDRFEADRAFFSFLHQKSVSIKKSTRHLQVSHHIKWAMVAAVTLTAVLIPVHHWQNRNQDVAYENGIRLTDKNHIRQLALGSIRSLNLDADEVGATMDNMETNTIVENQLKQFQAFE